MLKRHAEIYRRRWGRHRGNVSTCPQELARYLSRSAAREPAVAHAVLDQPDNALATRAFEQADIVASVDGFECNRDAFHTARETAWQQRSNFHIF